MSTPPDYPPAFLAQDRRKPAAIGMVVTTALSTIVVLVRLYARGFLIRELGWDDYTIVIAQLVAWLDMALSLMDVHYGCGQHVATLISHPENMVLMYKWLVAAQMVYFLSLWLCRVSGLFFYSRLNPMPQFQLYMRISFVFVTAVFVSQALVIAVQCIPLQALWDPTVKGKCMGSTAVFLSTSVLTIVCDSLILILPTKIILGLHVNFMRKLVLGFVVCFGVFAIVTSILRMVAMIVALQHPEDITWYFSVVVAWSSAEISAFIIALSLPSLRGLFGFLRNKGNSKSGQSSGSRSIGLGSVPRTAKHKRIYDGPNFYQNSVDIETQRNVQKSPSQEALWDDRDRQKIRVMDVVHVDVDDLHPQK
ncbi:hypothetical protein N7474_001685 [Penicillium riverlandense]|uniref:uncharacterized protein n=1 Tax=Penicillium riverlandense TaxID=1903569 RepID=UPI0025478F5A|nr:uncharacterized protein N7474_001685 [Penicillium riverlandense]KAJ5833374.1 hypothetical protein N7474_001685 [Penicillium riverlandense]